MSGFFVSVMAAGLRGRIPLADNDIVFSLHFELVLVEDAEHPKPIIRNSFPKIERLRHSSQVNIFYTYGIIGIGYLPTELVAKV